MAFSINGINRVSAGANTNAPAFHSYYSATDNGATIAGSGYFNDYAENLRVGTFIYVRASDGPGFYYVTAVTPNVTTSALATIGVGGVGSANFQAGAVDTAALGDGAVTSDKVAEGMIQHATVIASDADVQGMHVTPIELVATPGAGKKIHPMRVTYNVDYGGVVFADGGAIHVQYDDTTLGAGPKATGTQSAASLIGATADTTFALTPVDTTLVDATTLNTPLCLSNATGAFTGGTGTELIIDIWYAICDYT